MYEYNVLCLAINRVVPHTHSNTHDAMLCTDFTMIFFFHRQTFDLFIHIHKKLIRLQNQQYEKQVNFILI